MFHTDDMNVMVPMVRLSSGVMVAVWMGRLMLICLLALKGNIQL